MIDIFKLWERFCGKVNTHQGGHARPNRNFLGWVNDIRLEIFEEEYKAWEKSQIITDRMSPFLRSVNVVVAGVSNQMWDLVKLPADYAHFASARQWKRGQEPCGCTGCDTIDSTTGKKSECKITVLDADEVELAKINEDSKICESSIDKVDNARWSALCSHKTLSPQKTGEGKCTQYDGGLKIAPKGLGIIILDYFRLPIEAKFNYDILNPNTENEYIQYNPNGSQSLEFSELLIPEFLDRLQIKYAGFIREGGLWQQGEAERRSKA